MKTIIVLGMHRSVTSLVAKGLHEAGVEMGDHLLGPHPSQPHGHWENVEALHLNMAILKAAGGNYRKPPPEEAILAQADAFAERIQTFIRENQRDPLWGWKDPRTVLTIRLFMPYLINPHFVTCWRDVNEVARSLHARGDCSLAKGRALAIEYNRRLLRFLDDHYVQNQL